MPVKTAVVIAVLVFAPAVAGQSVNPDAERFSVCLRVVGGGSFGCCTGVGPGGQPIRYGNCGPAAGGSAGGPGGGVPGGGGGADPAEFGPGEVFVITSSLPKVTFDGQGLPLPIKLPPGEEPRTVRLPGYALRGLETMSLVLTNVLGPGGYLSRGRAATDEIEKVISSYSHTIEELEKRYSRSTEEVDPFQKSRLPELSNINQQAIDQAEAEHKRTSELKSAIEQLPQGPALASFTDLAIDLLYRDFSKQGSFEQLRTEIGEHLRPTGPPLLGLLGPVRRDQFGTASETSASISQEILKQKAWQANAGGTAGEALSAAAGLLDKAQAFAAAGTQEADAAADALTGDAQMIRYQAAGLTSALSVAVVGIDGRLSREPVASFAELPPNALARRVDEFEGRVAAATLAHQTITGSARYQGLTGVEKQRADFSLIGALRYLTASRRAFSAADFEESERMLRFAEGLLDVATGSVPLLSLGRDIYELITGMDLITGEDLSFERRCVSAFGVLTFGSGTWLKKTSQIVDESRGVLGAGVKEGLEEAVQQAGKGLWSSTGELSAVENAFGHWSQHGNEFPNLQNAKQYVESARDFLGHPPAGVLTKTRANGDVLLYDAATNTFAVKNVEGVPRTMFKPRDGAAYFDRQH